MKTKYLLALLAVTLVGCGQNTTATATDFNANDGSVATSICCWQAPIVEYAEDVVYELDTNIKQALAYMWNEEKLAKDLYLAFYALYPTNIFKNIATRSEVLHQFAVENLLGKYNIDATDPDLEDDFSQAKLDSLEAGKYANPTLQTLYGDLYTKGSSSIISALQMGCVVEVTDIEDLEKYTQEAQTNSEVTATYEFLKAGSYNHYWSFDSVLKRYGVSNGCCSVGDDYCHNEYPQTSLGYNVGSANGSMNGGSSPIGIGGGGFGGGGRF